MAALFTQMSISAEVMKAKAALPYMGAKCLGTNMRTGKSKLASRRKEASFYQSAGFYSAFMSSLMGLCHRLPKGRGAALSDGGARKQSSSPAMGSRQVGRLAISLGLPLGLFLVVLFSVAGAMQEMHDEDLANITGQALMQMASTQGEGVSSDITFYKAGLDAALELNMNIEKLQLGCGGVNGAGCDIDIDQLSLSGQCETGRPGCSATLTRPFFEFAIKNDDSKTLREVVGIRMSAEQTVGMLTAGKNGPTPNGINTLSGYMTTTPISGTAYTQATNIGCGRTNAANCAGGIKDPYSTVLSFDTDPDIVLCTNGCYAGNTGTSVPSQSNGVYIPSLQVDFDAAGAVINGTRETSTAVTAFAPVPDVSLAGGQLFVTMEDTISVAYFISVSEATVNLGGTVRGLNTQINFTQDLGYIHRINVDSPFSLSFQKDDVKWPGSQPADIAQRGWWMSFADPVELGELNPVQQIDISPAFSQMAQAFNNHFAVGCTQPCAGPIPIETEQGLDQLFSGQMTVDVGLQTIVTSPLIMNVSDLELGATQDVPRNCWGAASFC